MPDLFESQEPNDAVAANAPLATRMRPRTLDEFVGQQHILGEGKLLRRAIQADRIASIIFWGPPGTGKTSLAQVIANATKSVFVRLSGVESSVADVRKAIAIAANRLQTSGQRTILFIDEIHRFNKAQQDVLLPDVESGTVRLIGATTHNPMFYVIGPLVSRSQIFELKALTHDDIKTLLRRALSDPSTSLRAGKELGLGNHKVTMDDDALDFLATASDGDARKALNSLEVAVLTTPPDKTNVIHITRAIIEESIQKKAVVYDRDEDAHYDTISAFIKSMRGSDPDAAIYWLAKMLHAGEDIRFIARRMVILASEDIGLADPNALVVASAAQQATELVGMPEAQLILAEAVIYLSCAPKSNSTANAIWTAMSDVASGRTLEVPDHLKDAHYKGAERLGHGKDYKYAHDFKDHHVEQEYLPAKEGIPEKKTYYEPSDQGLEPRVRERLEKLRKKK